MHQHSATFVTLLLSKTTLFLSYISNSTTVLRQLCIRELLEFDHLRIVRIASPHNAQEAQPVKLIIPYLRHCAAVATARI
jgi:hypothetical protein